jgi:hypothetical protein
VRLNEEEITPGKLKKNKFSAKELEQVEKYKTIYNNIYILRDETYKTGTTDCLIVIGIFKKSMGARHRGVTRFSYRSARLHRLAEFIPWNQCRGPINI